jgi:hypothetical protein
MTTVTPTNTGSTPQLYGGTATNAAPQSALQTYFGNIQNAYAGATPIYGPDGNITGWNQPNATSPTTQQPFTGTSNGTQYTAGTPSGVQVPYTNNYINPNDAASRYQGVSIGKNPGVTSATNNLLSAFNSGSDLSNFNDLLGNERSGSNALTAGFNADQNTFSTTPATTATALNNNVNTFANTGANLNNQYSNVLGQTNAAENNIVQQATNLLPAYDQAVTNVGNQEQNALQQDVSRYKLGTGTPGSLGSGEENLLIQGTQAAQVPLEEAKINQNYNLLQNLDLPVAQAQGQAAVNQITGFEEPLAATNYSNTSTTANQIAQLQLQVAGMSMADATKYMEAQGIPAQVQQQILSGNVSNLGGINNLLGQSQYQGLQDVLGANLSQPTASSFVAPGVQPSRYSNPGQPTISPQTFPGNLGGATTPGATGGAPTQPVGQLTQVPNSTLLKDTQGNLWWPNGQLYQPASANQVFASNNSIAPTSAYSQLQNNPTSATDLSAYAAPSVSAADVDSEE